MGTPFLGEVKITSFNFAPKGWALCNGQLLPINQNQALFSLLGTQFGGDGRVNFALPDLRGQIPIHAGGPFAIGNKGGEESHTLAKNEMPAHNHVAQGSSANGNAVTPGGSLLGAFAALYAPLTSPIALLAATISNAGGSQAHENRQPFLTLSFCIALQGIFPSRN